MPAGFFPSELDGRTRFLTVFVFTWHNGNCEYAAGSLRKIIITLRTVCAVYLTTTFLPRPCTIIITVKLRRRLVTAGVITFPPLLSFFVREHLNNRYFAISFSSKTDDLKDCCFFFVFEIAVVLFERHSGIRPLLARL